MTVTSHQRHYDRRRYCHVSEYHSKLSATVVKYPLFCFATLLNPSYLDVYYSVIMASSNARSHSFKVVLLGEGAVGKTSLVLRYVENKFNDKHLTTLQVGAPPSFSQIQKVRMIKVIVT